MFSELPRHSVYSDMPGAKEVEVEESSKVVLKCEIEFDPEFYSIGWARAKERDSLRFSHVILNNIQNLIHNLANAGPPKRLTMPLFRVSYIQ